MLQAGRITPGYFFDSGLDPTNFAMDRHYCRLSYRRCWPSAW